MVRRILVPLIAGLFLLLLLILLLAFGFVARRIEVTGVERYTEEEILSSCGIEKRDNLILLSEKAVEDRLKAKYPYIKAVNLKKNYPSALTIEIIEEYTTFYYESEGEYFLFNHSMRLMEKFDSEESLTAVRKAIFVKIPLPKSSIVPQYIQMQPKDDYVLPFLEQLSSSEMLLELVVSLDLSDKFCLRMVCSKGVDVSLGDYTRMEEKLSALQSLLKSSLEGKEGSGLTGRVDLSAYPNCFYDLKPEYTD